MTDEVKNITLRQSQSKADKQSTRDKFLTKKRRTKDVELNLNGEKVTVKFEAMSSTELDDLRAKHKPTTQQRADGLGVNIDTFNPALVARTIIDPELSLDDVKAIWKSDEWSSGELGALFNAASDVCMEGMNIPFRESA